MAIIYLAILYVHGKADGAVAACKVPARGEGVPTFFSLFILLRLVAIVRQFCYCTSIPTPAAFVPRSHVYPGRPSGAHHLACAAQGLRLLYKSCVVVSYASLLVKQGSSSSGEFTRYSPLCFPFPLPGDALAIRIAVSVSCMPVATFSTRPLPPPVPPVYVCCLFYPAHPRRGTITLATPLPPPSMFPAIHAFSMPQRTAP